MPHFLSRAGSLSSRYRVQDRLLGMAVQKKPCTRMICLTFVSLCCVLGVVGPCFLPHYSVVSGTFLLLVSRINLLHSSQASENCSLRCDRVLSSIKRMNTVYCRAGISLIRIRAAV